MAPSQKASVANCLHRKPSKNISRIKRAFPAKKESQKKSITSPAKSNTGQERCLNVYKGKFNFICNTRNLIAAHSACSDAYNQSRFCVVKVNFLRLDCNFRPKVLVVREKGIFGIDKINMMWKYRLMARPLRIQYPGAYYHVMNRGNRREDIFITDTDRSRFVAVFGR